jgi:hypothetical protein
VKVSARIIGTAELARLDVTRLRDRLARIRRHASIASMSKFPVSGSGAGKPRAIRFGRAGLNVSSAIPMRCAAIFMGASPPGNKRKRISSLLSSGGLPRPPSVTWFRISRENRRPTESRELDFRWSRLGRGITF